MTLSTSAGLAPNRPSLRKDEAAGYPRRFSFRSSDTCYNSPIPPQPPMPYSCRDAREQDQRNG